MVRGREPVVLWFDAETTALWQESAMKNISEILASVEETPVTFEDYLKAYADQVGELINSYIPHGTHGDMDRYLYDPLYHYSENAGKRHRPLICFAACLAVGGDPDRAATAAAAIEHFHSAALIHDDIADEAELRRGEPCLHLTEGLGLAINMGDLALSMVNGPVVNDPLLEDAVKVLKDGDGNGNAAPSYKVATSPIGGSKGTLSYDVLLDFWAQFDPYTMNTMLVSNDMMLAMLKLSEFQNPNTGLNFQATGKLTTPLGAKLLRSSAVPAGTIIGLDKNYALEQICGSEVVVEYDKLIDRQLERAAITSVSGFAKLFTDAAKVLKV